MARDAIAITTLAKNASTAQPSGTAINTTNGAKIATNDTRKLVVLIANTITNAAKVATIKSGVKPPAMQADLGDLAISVPQSATTIVTLESARFIQADGSVYIDFAAGMTGTVDAWKIPDGI